MAYSEEGGGGGGLRERSPMPEKSQGQIKKLKDQYVDSLFNNAY